jgi:hypothetical protein
MGVSALEHRLAEQPAIEKWHGAKGARGARSAAHRRVERAEPERQEHALMERAATRHARVELPREEGAVPVEPAFRLEKGEKEQARRGEEGKLAPLLVGDARQ